jgi:hypothetical protein
MASGCLALACGDFTIAAVDQPQKILNKSDELLERASLPHCHYPTRDQLHFFRCQFLHGMIWPLFLSTLVCMPCHTDIAMACGR